MLNPIETISTEVQKFNDSIIEALDSKNITNTGEAARSLRVEAGNDYVRSYGIFYLEFLDTGRGPGKPPLFHKILEWAMQRTRQTKSECWGLAVYVTDKIARLGTEIFRNNSKGIELSKKIVNLQENINNEVTKDVKYTLTQKLDYFKKEFMKKNFQI